MSMATFAAMRLQTMLDNVALIVAIELLAAAQGIEFHHPQTSSKVLESVVSSIREISPAYSDDRSMSDDFAELADRINQGSFYGFAESILPCMKA